MKITVEAAEITQANNAIESLSRDTKRLARELADERKPPMPHLDGLYEVPFPGRLDFVEARIAECEAELHALRIEAERLDPEYDGAGESRRNWLVFKVGKAMIHLRDAEDFARFKMPAWPTADRIRWIHQHLTDDVLNGSTQRPTPAEALARFRGEPWESPWGRRRG